MPSQVIDPRDHPEMWSARDEARALAQLAHAEIEAEARAREVIRARRAKKPRRKLGEKIVPAPGRR